MGPDNNWCASCGREDTPRGDMREAVQMLAADNARLCERLIAAEKVVSEIHAFLATRRNAYALRKALDDYDAGKPS